MGGEVSVDTIVISLKEKSEVIYLPILLIKETMGRFSVAGHVADRLLLEEHNGIIIIISYQ